jgi:hypothetical protein
MSASVFGEIVTTPRTPHRTVSTQYGLKVNSYDRVSSLLLALVVLLAVAVLVLAVIWLSNRMFLRQEAVPVEFERIGSGEGPLRQSDELAAPEMEVTDPTVPNVADRLSAVADAISDTSALMDDVATGATSQAGVSGSGGDGIGGGGGGGDGKPRRWELVFAGGGSLDSYAAQLDHFGIELGVLLPGGEVGYASGLSGAKPNVRRGPAEAEDRYYLTWRSGDLEQADRELLTRAGLPVEGRIIMKFLPRELEGRMLALERDRAGSKAARIYKTRFGVVPRDSGWDIIVFDQSYR